MSPPLAQLELFRRVLRIIDQNVGAARKLEQRLVKFRNARFVISGVHNDTGGRFEAKAQAILRVIQPAGCHSRVVQSEAVATRHFGKLAPRGHRTKIHREVGISHLCLKDALQALGADEFRTKAMEAERIAGRIEGCKERDSLYVVPMVVRDKNIRVNAFSGPFRLRRPAIAQHTKPSTTIQNYASAIGSRQFDARRIAAIPPRRAVNRRG